MTYNLDEVRIRVAKKRKRFVFCISVFSLLLFLCTLMTVLNISNTISFVSLVFGILFFAVIFILVKTHSPNVLFSKEVRGTNVLEHEYVAYRSRGGALKFGYRDRPGLAPELRDSVSVDSARRSYLKAGVYLKLENESVIYIRHLSPSHTDIYEIGDILLKPAGTGVPIIISRTTDKQPCPICATINKKGQSNCRQCGLEILK